MAPMKIRLRMFGGLAASAGVSEDALELDDGATAATVIDAVARRWPQAEAILERVSVAVNLETVGRDQPLSDGDEVALLPPVAGGAGDAEDAPGPHPAVRITTGVRDEAISIDEVMGLIASPDAGGAVVFVGTVRAQTEDWGVVDQLAYTIYREMAEPVMATIAQECAERWPLNGVCILHRVGDLPVGQQTVVVAASAPHRGEAFDAARYGIDEVKKRVPVWKQEFGPDAHRWVGLDGAAEGESGARPEAGRSVSGAEGGAERVNG